MSEMIKIVKGDYLIRENEESSEMFVVQKGTLGIFKSMLPEDEVAKLGKSFVPNPDNERQIGTVYVGEVVGEMSFLDKAPRSASVRALTDSQVLIIPRENFDKTFESLPTWYKALVDTLLDRLREVNKKIRI